MADLTVYNLPTSPPNWDRENSSTSSALAVLMDMPTMAIVFQGEREGKLKAEVGLI